MRTRILSLLPAGLLLVAVSGQTSSDTPPFDQVLGLVRAHLAGVAPGEIDRAATQGLLDQLAPRVQLVEATATAAEAGESVALLGATGRIGQRFGYVHVREVAAGTAAAIRAERARWTGPSPLEGLILDLRFAAGTDYAEVVRVASDFLAQPQPLLDWGQGMQAAAPGSDGFRAPLLVLINEETRGAAEALAAVLRQTERALTIGRHSAGLAFVYETYPLGSGQGLRIATGLVHLGDGRAMPSSGVTADLEVPGTAAQERAHLAGFAKALAEAGAAHEEQPDSTGAEASPNGASRTDRAVARAMVLPVDPCLARALDLLTGLAVVEHRDQS